jgi:hypothetical protein
MVKAASEGGGGGVKSELDPDLCCVFLPRFELVPSIECSVP